MGLLILSATFCGYKVHTLAGRHETIKEDISKVNNIAFGLLSVSQWREKIEMVVSERIESLSLTKAQQDSLEKQISIVLHSLVDKADSLMTSKKESLGGELKKLAYKIFVDEDKLHEQVPAFTQKIMSEILKPSSKERLKFLAESKLEQFAAETYDSSQRVQTNITDSILQKYKVQQKAAFEKKTGKLLPELKRRTYYWSTGLLGAVLITLAAWYVLRRRQYLHGTLYIMSIVLALVLLLTGLTTSMIEIDARIQSLDFHLLGEKITFSNQVLFFQSKSIVDVVAILIRTGRLDSIVVGVLILCFSILVPVAKLSSTGIYLKGKWNWSRNKVVHYLAFKSGKWSMADVMVVAIFMAYIGFNSILDDQLKGLEIRTDTITSISTNETALQPGYIIFTGFVIFGLVLSQILTRVMKENK